LAYFKDYETAAIDMNTEGLLMAPAYAVGKMLQRNRLALQDFDFYEIHEAFAAQVLCTLKAWESEEFCKKRIGLEKALGSIDRKKLNTVGSSVALGHPFAATGARIVASLSKLLSSKTTGRGLISVCTGGGMGTAAILEKTA
jgi:acetyl-CoA C-acetyltransferase